MTLIKAISLYSEPCTSAINAHYVFAHTQKEVEPSQRVVRLHQSSLDFATDNVTDPSSSPALFPLQEVNYVERCTCPSSRVGSVCQGCSEGYTFDPSFGGEFAHCVRCFCNFRSTSCDPVSGVCANCTANTGGDRCEICAEGFDRVLPISFLPCDQCAPGLFAAGNGSCIRKDPICYMVLIISLLLSLLQHASAIPRAPPPQYVTSPQGNVPALVVWVESTATGASLTAPEHSLHAITVTNALTNGAIESTASQDKFPTPLPS